MKIALVSSIFARFDIKKTVPKQSVPCDYHFFDESNSPFPLSSLNDRLKAKYFKTQMHHVLPDYDIYIWVDGSLQIDSPDFVKTIVEQLGSNDFAIRKHPVRNCMYVEAAFIEAQIKQGSQYIKDRYGDSAIRKEVEHYRELDFPANAGLYAGWMFAYRPSMSDIMDRWWQACLEWSHYDQFSLRYLLKDTKVSLLNIDNLYHMVNHADTIVSKYNEYCGKLSDINEHLPVLKEYASKCDHVTEFGVRSVVSTYAFIEAKCPVIKSYDIEDCPNIDYAKQVAYKESLDLSFHKQSTLKAVIEETDLLFIDTLHTYEQLKKELDRHHDKVKKYMVFHDVVTFGYSGEIEGTNGLMPAIIEFLAKHDEWRIEKHLTNNNGLLILKRCEPILKDVKFSIVIPTYEQNGHGHTTLSQLLSSIVKQKCKYQFEIVISDNSKDDKIKEVAEIFSNRFDIHYVRCDKIGVSNNTNNAIDHAKYSVIKPMYQDDVLIDKNALNHFCENIKHSGWVISDSFNMDENLNETVQVRANFDPHRMTPHNPVGMPSVTMFRKNGTRFNPELKTMLDLEFYHKLYAKYGSPAFIRKPIVGQRFWKGQLSANQPNYANREIEYLKEHGKGLSKGLIFETVHEDRFAKLIMS